MNRTAHQRARDRQIRTLLALWDVPVFDVAALDHATGRLTLREDWGRGQVLHAVGWMARRNATGSTIHARPAGSLAAHPWVLVDDLDDRAKARVAKDHPPAAFLETSPGVWQAWIRLDQALDAATRADAGRRLAEMHGGAEGLGASMQLGRFPGFTNQDPEHREEGGRPPFTRLVDVHPEHEVLVESLPFELEPGTAVAVLEDELRPGEARDQSRIDFAIACRLVEIGEADRVIEAVLREIGRATDAVASSYIERTIAAARRRVEVREETADGANGAGREEGADVRGGLH